MINLLGVNKMALEDRLKNMADTRIRPDTYCAYQVMYDALNSLDKEALDNAWAKGYSQNIVLLALRAEGIKSSNESIRAHRNGLCKCPNK
jgi:hypothetical protein